MRQLNLILVWQHHQPIGNLPDVLENCYTRTYLPMLEAIEKYPGLHVNLYYSGPVLQFFKEKHPDFISRLGELARRGQVEILAGAFYEPVLSDLYPEDRVGQITKSVQWIQSEFGVKPRGMWLAEGVWDSQWIPAIKQSGIEFTILGSEFFHRGGLKQSSLTGHYVTDFFGETLEVFPENPSVLRFVPTQSFDELIACFRRLANRGDKCSVLCSSSMENWGHDAGAKATSSTSYLDQLFAKLQASSEWVKLLTFEEYRREFSAQSWVTLPAGMRVEMQGWALPGMSRQDFQFTVQDVAHRHDADRFKPFLQAGGWENFRGRYREANLMFRKVLYLRRKLNSTHPQYEEMLDLLWQAQCNTVYWYGSFGGIYFTHLRQAVWKNLAMVERILRADQEEITIEKTDLLGDGRAEYHIISKNSSFAFKPDYGGVCFEALLFDFNFNLCNVVTRRIEIPPQQTLKTSEPLVEDWYLRRCFQDHFLAKNVSAVELMENRYTELGDFMNQPYEVVESGVKDAIARLVMERKGGVYRQNVRQAVTVRKTIQLDTEKRVLEAKYFVKNESELPLEAVFAVEFNLLLGNHPDNPELCCADGKKVSVKDLFEARAIQSMQIETVGFKRLFCTEMIKPMDFWMLPIKVLHEKQEWLYQGTSLVFGAHIDLMSQECYEQTLCFHVTNQS